MEERNPDPAENTFTREGTHLIAGKRNTSNINTETIQFFLSFSLFVDVRKQSLITVVVGKHLSVFGHVTLPGAID